MIVIKIPYRFVPEKRYVLEYLFGSIYGIEYKLEVSEDCTAYEILLSNHSSVVIEDHFFQQLGSDEKGFKPSRRLIPSQASLSRNKYSSEQDLPVIYGSGDVLDSGQKINCGIDIVASIFFMLSRWEEMVSDTKDIHGRFPAQESFAWKNDFLHRPLVNEYAEMIWNMLSSLDPLLKREERAFNMLFTHDIDMLFKYQKGTVLKRLAGHLIKRRSAGLFFKDFIEYLTILLNLRKDPYDSFQQLMDLSESCGCQSEFYFMGGGNSVHDNRYRITSTAVAERIVQIVARGHRIGAHFSYNALKQDLLLAAEIGCVGRVAAQKIKLGRGHFLNLTIPDSFKILDANKITYDSTVSFATHCGFRAGVSQPYHPWNFEKREQYEVTERPLVLMDTTLTEHMKLSAREVLAEISYYYRTVKKYHGELVLLIHNSTDPKMFDLFRDALGGIER